MILHLTREKRIGMSYFKQQKLDARKFTIAHHANNWHPLNFARL